MWKHRLECLEFLLYRKCVLTEIILPDHQGVSNLFLLHRHGRIHALSLREQNRPENGDDPEQNLGYTEALVRCDKGFQLADFIAKEKKFGLANLIRIQPR